LSGKRVKQAGSFISIPQMPPEGQNISGKTTKSKIVKEKSWRARCNCGSMISRSNFEKRMS
jgi:hypothetical protein